MAEKKKKAYMTMEAALVFPFVLASVIFTIYLGFYLYNAGTLKMATYAAALRGSRVMDASMKETEEYTKNQLEELTKETLLLKEEINKNVKVSLQKIQVHGEFKMEDSVMDGLPLFKIIETKAEAEKINPVSIIRGVRIVNEYTISK